MWNFGANGTRKNTHKQTWTPNYMQCWCGTRPSSMLEWLWSNWIQSSGLNFCANWGAKYEVNIEFLLAPDYTVLSIALLLFFFISHSRSSKPSFCAMLQFASMTCKTNFIRTANFRMSHQSMRNWWWPLCGNFMTSNMVNGDMNDTMISCIIGIVWMYTNSRTHTHTHWALILGNWPNKYMSPKMLNKTTLQNVASKTMKGSITWTQS